MLCCAACTGEGGLLGCDVPAAGTLSGGIVCGEEAEGCGAHVTGRGL